MDVRWVTAFLDGVDPATLTFWQRVTDSVLSPWREDTFATLQPTDGDAYLRVQRTNAGTPGCHLDLHVPGAAFQVRRSPAGLPSRMDHPARADRPALLRHVPHPAHWHRDAIMTA